MNGEISLNDVIANLKRMFETTSMSNSELTANLNAIQALFEKAEPYISKNTDEVCQQINKEIVWNLNRALQLSREMAEDCIAFNQLADEFTASGNFFK